MTRSVDDLAADVERAFEWYADRSKTGKFEERVEARREFAAALSELVALVGTLTHEVARCEAEIDEMDRRRADEWSRAEAAEAALTDMRRALEREVELLGLSVAAFAPHGGDSRRTGDYYAADRIMESVDRLRALAAAGPAPEEGQA